MEADSLSGSCLLKVSPGHEVLVAMKRDSLTLFIWKNTVLCLDRFFGLKNRRKTSVILVSVGPKFTRSLRFGTYRTIVLGPQQPSIEKIASLVFHSTNLTTDGSTLFSVVVVCQKFPQAWSFGSYQTRVYKSLTTSVWTKVSSMSRSIIWSAGAKRLLNCLVPAATFTRALRFDNYW